MNLEIATHISNKRQKVDEKDLKKLENELKVTPVSKKRNFQI
jgi:hypothetical protein